MNNPSSSAFPVPMVSDGNAVGDVNQHGMTLREYFAAHAPAEPQKWFEPAMSPKPTQPPLEFNDFPADFPDRLEDRNYIKNLCSNWRRDSCFDLHDYEVAPADSASRAHCNALLALVRPELASFETEWLDYRAARDTWETEQKKQRLIQWPWAWADAVLVDARRVVGGE